MVQIPRRRLVRDASPARWHAENRKNSATATQAKPRRGSQLRRHQTGQIKTATKLTVAEAFDAFLDWANREKKPATFEHYRYFLQNFADTGVKAKPVSDLIPHHLTKWLQAHGWNSTSRYRAVSCVKRALSWCVQEGLIADHPLKAVRKDAC